MIPENVEAEFNGALDHYLGDWEKTLRAHLKDAQGEDVAQMSIVDPPLRDRAASKPARKREDVAAAAAPLAAAIRRRLDALLKKN